MFLAQTLTYHGLWASDLAAVFFIGKGKGPMTFLALIFCDRRRQLEMKKYRSVLANFMPSSLFPSSLLLRKETKPTATSSLPVPLRVA